MKRIWETMNNWEQWPFFLRYLLILPVWGWYCLRSGAVWFFTPSNPTITFGGFEGEGKKEMYDLLPPHTYPKSIFVQPHIPFEKVKATLAERQFTYPFCAKPDVGMKGLLFRKIDSENMLEYYHSQMPVEYIIQDLVVLPLEVSVFYYRFPDKASGVITGFIQKELMEVTGDGQSTLLQLVQRHPKARLREEEMRMKHAAHLDRVLQPGERFFLSYAANLNRGARFVNLQHLVDGDLLKVFDELSHKGRFYYGRYDLKCNSIEELKRGINYSILEFNGSGAEPNHVYNMGYSLFRALGVFLFHWRVLYRIARYNRHQGIPCWSFLRGWRFLRAARQHFRRLETLDTQIRI